MGNACQIWSNVACTKLKLWMVFDNLSWAQSNKYINLTNALFNHIEQVLLCRIFNYSLPRMLEAFWCTSPHNCLSWTQFGGVNGIWQMAEGTIKETYFIKYLVIYNRSFHVEFLIFVFRGCWRLFEGFLNCNCLFWVQKGLQTWYCTTNTNGSGHKH